MQDIGADLQIGPRSGSYQSFPVNTSSTVVFFLKKKTVKYYYTDIDLGVSIAPSMINCV